MSNDEIAAILRRQAWQRAKGELNSILDTYYGEENKFEPMSNAIDDFVARVEENGWTE